MMIVVSDLEEGGVGGLITSETVLLIFFDFDPVHCVSMSKELQVHWFIKAQNLKRKRRENKSKRESNEKEKK